MMQEIEVFGEGGSKGFLDVENNMPAAAVMELVYVTLPDGGQSAVLHIKDMTYGIVIPEAIRIQIETVLADA